jgi:hypothetical protein
MNKTVNINGEHRKYSTYEIFEKTIVESDFDGFAMKGRKEGQQSSSTFKLRSEPLKFWSGFKRMFAEEEWQNSRYSEIYLPSTPQLLRRKCFVAELKWKPEILGVIQS